MGIKELIVGYENEIFTEEEAITKINAIIVDPIETYSLNNYWRSEDLDEFVERLTNSNISAPPLNNEKHVKTALQTINVTVRLSTSCLPENRARALPQTMPARCAIPPKPFGNFSPINPVADRVSPFSVKIMN